MKLSRILMLFVMLCMLNTSALARTPEDAENTVALIQAFPVYDEKYKIIEVDNTSVDVALGSSYGTGTGFAVGKAKGSVEYFVTNYHVVDVPDTTTVVYVRCDLRSEEPILDKDGNPYLVEYEVPVTGAEYYVVFESEETRVAATHVATSDRADLAVIKLDEPSNKRESSILRPYDTLEKQDVYPLGFPGVATDLIGTSDDGAQHVQSTKGRINSFYTHQETGEGDQFIMDAPITHGNSGGPVVDENGHVVGVSVSGHGQYINMNVAISINEVVRMLDSKKIPYRTVSDNSFNLTSTVIISVCFVLGLLFSILRKKKKAKPVIDGSSNNGGNVVIIDGNKDDGVIIDGGKDDVIIIDDGKDDDGKDDGGKDDDGKDDGGKDDDGKDDGGKDDGGNNARSLVCAAGVMQGQRFMLSASTTIGRDPSCTIALPDQTRGVSGRHCSISCVDGVVTVTDLGSSYGTWIDNVRLTPHQGMVMHRGHYLYLGSKQQAFVLRSGDVSSVIPNPAPQHTRSLVCDAGAMMGQRFALGESTVIGRHPTCTIILPEQTKGVSGRHCSISCVNGVVTVTDLGSKCGTWIDNVKLTPGQGMVMHRGHTLYLGSKEQAFTLRS